MGNRWHPLIEVPDIRVEGYNAMLLGGRMASNPMPGGFTFCPYAPETTERVNFLVGCINFVFPEGQR